MTSDAALGRTFPRVVLPGVRRAEHIMGMPLESARRWTAREVRGLIASQPLATPRYELVDGELLVTPSPGPAHQESVALLLVALRHYLEREQIGNALMSPSDVELEPEDVRQPDIYVLPATEWKRVIREGFPAHELLLAVEVLSPSSGHHDRVRKRPGYQRHVPDYWIVDVDARLIERWRPDDARPEITTDRVIWTPGGVMSPFVLELSQFFVRVWGEDA